MAPLGIDQPANYEIRVLGRVSSSWTGRLNEMRIELKADESWLTGPLEDQAALFGVLTALYDWGYVLISVRRITDPTQAFG